MNHIFAKRRQKLLSMKAAREGQIHGVNPVQEHQVRCPRCNQTASTRVLAVHQSVCPQCGYHHPLGSYQRLKSILDSGSFRPLDKPFSAVNPLNFPDYIKKVTATQEKTGMEEAVVCATGAISGHSAVVAVMDGRFFRGSMGTVVGERITQATEYAMRKKLPLIIFSASGGARMQEGILSLMQMAKTSGALQRFGAKGGCYISVLTDPTTGGVTASFASLGDIILTEPGALIGFAGPRVIEQTIGQALPEGFQRAEFLQEHGFVDAIVPRNKMRDTLAHLLALHSRGGKLG